MRNRRRVQRINRRDFIGKAVGMGAGLAAGPGEDLMLTLSPTSGTAGTAVSINGSGFGRRQLVTLAWDGATAQSIQANPQGKFTATVIAPSAAGSHTLAASSATAASTATFTVSAAAPAPTPAPTNVTPPTAPSPYAIPAGAQLVTDGASLDAALAMAAHDIVLANGTYDRASGSFTNATGCRVYAQNLGMAVFKAGIALGGNWGPGGNLLQGLLMDVTDPTKTLQGGQITNWGSGARSVLRDLTLRGHSAIDWGIFAPQVDGLVIQRVDLQDFLNDGIRATTNGAAAVGTPMLIEDVFGRHCVRAVKGSSSGTAESVLWVGNPATIRRVKLRDAGVMGLWTGALFADSLVEDFDIDGAGVGHYMEHYTLRSTFQRFAIGPSVRVGINAEWYDYGTGASKDNVFQDGRIESTVVGLNMDARTERTTIRRTKFVGQCWAAIADNQGIGNLSDTAGNDYSGLPAGVPQIRKDQNLNTASCG